MADLNITAAKLAEHEGRLAPCIEIDGRWYVMGTRESLLAERLVTLEPVTVPPAKLTAARAAPVETFHATTHPKVVALARKAALLMRSPDAAPGSLL